MEPTQPPIYLRVFHIYLYFALHYVCNNPEYFLSSLSRNLSVGKDGTTCCY